MQICFMQTAEDASDHKTAIKLHLGYGDCKQHKIYKNIDASGHTVGALVFVFLPHNQPHW